MNSTKRVTPLGSLEWILYWWTYSQTCQALWRPPMFCGSMYRYLFDNIGHATVHRKGKGVSAVGLLSFCISEYHLSISQVFITRINSVFMIRLLQGKLSSILWVIKHEAPYGCWSYSIAYKPKCQALENHSLNQSICFACWMNVLTAHIRSPSGRGSSFGRTQRNGTNLYISKYLLDEQSKIHHF